jgi:uncharacterized protein (TIGR03083 family)
MLDRVGALRRSAEEVTGFCRDLTAEQWAAPSRAKGWTVQDTVAHLGGAAHALFGPASLRLLGSKDIERTNDEFVERARGTTAANVLAEFETWTGRLATMAAALLRTPVAAAPLPLGELGRFPARLLLSSAFVFDQQTHLRFDLAPALDLPAPAADPRCTALVNEWMFAVLANQLSSARPAWLNRPLTVVLHGPGGGTWRIGVGGAVTEANGVADSAARIEGTVAQFPAWGTRRTPWRECEVEVSGDERLGTALLDEMNII